VNIRTKPNETLILILAKNPNQTLILEEMKQTDVFPIMNNIRSLNKKSISWLTQYTCRYRNISNQLNWWSRNMLYIHYIQRTT